MFRITGANEVASDLHRLANEVPQKAQEEVEGTARKVESTAKQIGTAIWDKRPQVSVPTINVGIEGSNAYVEVASRGGFFQEIGTSNHPPKPALQPALDAHRDEFEENLSKLVDGS